MSDVLRAAAYESLIRERIDRYEEQAQQINRNAFYLTPDELEEGEEDIFGEIIYDYWEDFWKNTQEWIKEETGEDWDLGFFGYDGETVAPNHLNTHGTNAYLYGRCFEAKSAEEFIDDVSEDRCGWAQRHVGCKGKCESGCPSRRMHLRGEQYGCRGCRRDGDNDCGSYRGPWELDDWKEVYDFLDNTVKALEILNNAARGAAEYIPEWWKEFKKANRHVFQAEKEDAVYPG